MIQRIITRISLVSLCISLSLLYSCRNEDEIVNQQEKEENTVTASNSVQGIIRIKLNQYNTQSLSVSLKSNQVSTNLSKVDEVLSSIGAKSFKRTFPYSGKYEARTQKEGLHLWYDVKYDTSVVALSKVISQFKELSEVTVTEPIRTIQNQKTSYKDFGPIPLTKSLKSTSKTADTEYPFNDTFLPAQWHYYNDGSITDAVVGADINLFDAWLKQRGNEEVIVAVIDGGIDVDHEDLINNIWHNQSEDGGATNTDDDNNGYTDDVYGYNFVDYNGTIVAHDHGTHVAGTIGAMNDNGIGVCGIAGGDSKTPGVKLMSCQVFESDRDGEDISAENFEEAIKYAADNGAVICQNSWGYDESPELPQSMKEAIDYFIKYAGIDENGNQVGPMAGGIVIFAAGNENVSTKAYPAMYEKVVAVASSAPDYIRAYYSNYGSWVDITAPGGSDEYNDLYDVDCYIASTAPENNYVYMIGTSMACPHVSGVAALVISEFGGEGFTPDMLKERLYRGAVDIDGYNTEYAGMLGVGQVNAAATLANYNSIPPERVTDLSVTASSNKATLSWSVTSDADDYKASAYRIYYSKSPFSENDVTTQSMAISSTSVLVKHAEVGETISATITDLDFASTYYFSVVGYDILGSYGDYSSNVSATTDPNLPPVIITDNETIIEVKAHETKYLTFSITEPDEEAFTWSYTDESGNSTAAELSTSEVRITINGLTADPGTYEVNLYAEDATGLGTSYPFTYTILENHTPVLSQSLNNYYIGNPDKAYDIALMNYFTDEDGEDLDFDITFNSNYINVSEIYNSLTINPVINGLSTVTITASDARGETATATFQVMVRDDSNEIDIYPNPVSDIVNFRMGEDVNGALNVSIYNSNGGLVDQRNTSISAFAPGSLNLSDLSTGQYELEINYNNTVIKRNIVKL
ncbi:S8 family serine peptidase [Plebeiibacterium sediminum]|uniref:S8 family serine peptidase n=1 Tax=Plebeiibacterium sediminum TaxID=2992112 RepID=A0AAE3M4C9_9BACT|nr:S8 family serine peptidase [Plebeiobacterium sediminum]MCW3786997.1 S8 family serine peptidase [Plebeiobacterium sediminum]